MDVGLSYVYLALENYYPAWRKEASGHFRCVLLKDVVISAHTKPREDTSYCRLVS